MSEFIPFNRPYMTGLELSNIARAHQEGALSGDGPFTAKCHQWLEDQLGCQKALLTHSCTAALEMSAILLDLQPGDEVIMPSYTFVSTANAFALRGAVPVFVDIRPDTLNLDETQIEEAITEKTRAIVPVHYAGVACEMDAIMALARRYDIAVVEDAAQGLMSKYRGRPLGSLGDLSAFSFHETKNVISGEGGCLSVNREDLVRQAEIVREKGTDRSQFMRGEVDKYTWQRVGSSYLPGELIAAFLWGQLPHASEITERRIDSWNYYHARFMEFRERDPFTLPVIPDHVEHNAHMFYVLLGQGIDRGQLLEKMVQRGVRAIFHYVPLHSSPAGGRLGRTSGQLIQTESLASRIVRLPLWCGMSTQQQDRVIEVLYESLP